MNKFRERQIDPPEPQCPRCRKICWPDDLVEGKCPHCSFDGSEDTCVVCKKPINPSSSNYGYSICEKCELEGHRRDYEEGRYDEYEHQEIEHYEELDKATENECSAIEQGATTEKELDEILNGDDAS